MRFWPLLVVLPMAACAEPQAWFEGPTDYYGHGAVADGEYSTLRYQSGAADYAIQYSNAVFEDTHPRLVDMNGDGALDVVTVVSDHEDGAKITVFGVTQGRFVPFAWGTPTGQKNRWYAIAGIADFDDDGRIEVAYIDRPHLAKILRFEEFVQDGPNWYVTIETELPGLTNHHYGSPIIEGGLRDCGQPEVVTADADWQRIMITGYDGTGYVTRDAGPYTGPDSLQAALNCD